MGASAGQAQPPTEPPAPQQPVALEVKVEPPEAKPGDVVTVFVRIKAEEALPEATLAATLGPGLGFEGVEGEGARFEAAERRLQWGLGPVGRGEKACRLRLRVQDDARDVTRQEFALQGAPEQGTLAVAQVAIRRTFPPAQTRVTPEEGGELRSADGRVRVVFPKGAVERPVRVEHRPKRADAMLPGQAGMALEFELNAFTDDEAAAPVRRFAKDLELRVDLSGLIDLESLPMHQYARLAYWDEAMGEWMGIRARREGNTLIGALDHFTTIGGGSANIYQKGWVLTFNDATVSTFSGGLTYDYPIKVPEGRGGLTPDLRLSYNSRRVDGILTWIQTDWAGLGWTLDTMEIVRRIEPAWDASSGSPAWCWEWFDWQNEFTLLYKGTGYKLKPGSSNPYGRYYTEDEQFLYIERRNTAGGNGSPVNQTSEYWIVRLRDGTEYRLGYNNDSEQTLHTNSGRAIRPSMWVTNRPMSRSVGGWTAFRISAATGSNSRTTRRLRTATRVGAIGSAPATFLRCATTC